ncbi:uncharacterized protein LOC143031981 [Oratosquilla oratoria]|uniref:uncharacterized protein LOC143031981 n=1 Tax=Oratosquilla oratoria TaxID=337810 RepID=UPI003F762AA3
MSIMPSDEELSRLAEAALLSEAKRASTRAEVYGPSGWLKPKLPPTNKVFLQNTILGAMKANKIQEDKGRQRRETGRKRRELSAQEANKYKRLYIHASTKVKKDNSDDGRISESHDSSKLSKNKPSEKCSIVWCDSGLEFSNVKREKEKKKEVNGKKMDLKRINFVQGETLCEDEDSEVRTNISKVKRSKR